ncbi:Hint domain-containing protein [Primorskyibacter sp. 2E107]|uniref:Hint domain-containing protein n=1 Tax=Primorskyibacter sp. 2E107 TaxID=3403458 RepID=UPI003AF41878
MTQLRHDLTVAHPVGVAHGLAEPRRNVALMRKYEAAALLPDLTVSFKSHIAPATPLFEETATAFARGTLFPTVRGPVAIEDLLPGDYIETASGAEPVMWIGSTTYIPGRDEADTTLTALTRVTAGAYGPDRPHMDLLVGPAARMVVRHPKLGTLLGQDAVLAPVRDYADGDRLLQITPAGPVQMYNLMTARHTTMKVGGIEMETYHPGKSAGQALGPNLRALFLSMFPNIAQLEDFGQVSLTRTSREVIDSLIDT